MYDKYKIILSVLIILIKLNDSRNHEGVKKHRNTRHRAITMRPLHHNKQHCMPLDKTLRARRKSCFLRPDTGPCRADIIQWYFDVKQRKCFRFFWGGCQGNGNKFQTQAECRNACYLNTSNSKSAIPHFCSLAFDYGNCFGQYNRWTWDKFSKSCRRRIYSGCGGNQNNFESRKECLDTCLNPPNNTVQRFRKFTTCIPYHIADIY